jgi:hypothetical protein
MEYAPARISWISDQVQAKTDHCPEGQMLRIIRKK